MKPSSKPLIIDEGVYEDRTSMTQHLMQKPPHYEGPKRVRRLHDELEEAFSKLRNHPEGYSFLIEPIRRVRLDKSYSLLLYLSTPEETNALVLVSESQRQSNYLLKAYERLGTYLPGSDEEDA